MIIVRVITRLNNIGPGRDRGRYQKPEPIKRETVSLTRID